MTHSLTVNLPDHLYRQLQRQAQVVNRPLNEVAAKALESLMVPVESDLPRGLQAELSAMAYLSDDALWQIAGSVMNNDKAALYDVLLERRRLGMLTPEGQAWLDTLRDEGDALMLRRPKPTRCSRAAATNCRRWTSCAICDLDHDRPCPGRITPPGRQRCGTPLRLLPL